MNSSKKKRLLAPTPPRLPALHSINEGRVVGVKGQFVLMPMKYYEL